MTPRPPVDLDALLLRQITGVWLHLNVDLFRSAMRPPALAWGASAHLGTWVRATRTIEIDRRLPFEHPWEVLVEVMKHEMAHQYVDEVLNVRDEAAHGPAFRSVCGRIGIDPAATGLPEGSAGATNRLVDRVRKLLALAESPNEHEAKLAMDAARRLMLEHDLDWVRSGEAPRSYAYRHLGGCLVRIRTHEKVLAGLLAEHFGVTAVWVPSFDVPSMRWGHVLEVCGTPEHLDVAEHVFHWLPATAERLWRAYKRAHGIPGDRDRRRFLVGVMVGFRERLAAGERRNRSEGLVRMRDLALDQFVGRRHPRLVASRGGRVVANDSFDAGRSAGRGLTMDPPVSGSAGPRLLGDRGSR